MNNSLAATAIPSRNSLDRFDGDLGARRSGKILIATSDAAHRESVSSYLLNRGQPFVTVESTQAALMQLQSGGIDLVVTALAGAEADGFELMRLVRKSMPGLPIILVTAGDAAQTSAYLDCAIGLKQEAVTVAREAVERLSVLTARERQVLDMVVTGRPNKVIAFELSISPRTVENHRAQVMRKLRVRSVAELVRLAVSAGQVETDKPASTRPLQDLREPLRASA
jgi:FixJ family two-component response regulator